MKNLALSLILLFPYFSCGSFQKLGNEKFYPDKDIYYSIDKIDECKIMVDGPQKMGFWKANKNENLVSVNISLFNPTNEKISITFDNIYAYEPKSDTNYKVQIVKAYGSAVDEKLKVQTIIKKESKIKRTLVFLIPKSHKISFLKVGGKLIELNTKK